MGKEHLPLYSANMWVCFPLAWLWPELHDYHISKPTSSGLGIIIIFDGCAYPHDIRFTQPRVFEALSTS
jgi:hypothetical protein